jgi:hypothetical protein
LRPGAWLAHFLVGVAILPAAVWVIRPVAAGLVALVGIAAMHQRLIPAVDGERRETSLPGLGDAKGRLEQERRLPSRRSITDDP